METACYILMRCYFTCSQTTAKATEFYNQKVKDLEANISDLEKIVQGKSTNLKIIEDGKASLFLPSNFDIQIHVANVD
jgi:hypothetical protein